LKNIFLNVLLVIIFQMMTLSPIWSQNEVNSQNSFAEKIYLQLDSEVYTTDKTIWFKAILANAAYHNLELTSGVLYVDLISFEENIMESKVIKIANGIGSGHFDLDRNYKPGSYLIRAYTEWNKNFDDDFIFQKYIQVYAETETVLTQQPITNIRRIDSTATVNNFGMDLYPGLIDDTHKSSLKIFIDVDGKKDTLYINKSLENTYPLNLSVPKTSESVKVKFQTRSGKIHATKFSPNSDFLDLQFFPEGGKLIQGLASKVGFKALDINGKAKIVEGDILNKKGEQITSFKGNRLGMGNFILNNLEYGETYTARLSGGKMMSLPVVFKQGYSVRVTKIRKVITIGVTSNYKTDTQITMSVASRGITYYNKATQLINGQYIFTFPENSFPEGVIVFKVMDENKQPIAERLYFNERKASRLTIETSLNKAVYEKRDKIQLGIKATTESNIGVKSQHSVMVMEKSRIVNATTRGTILSYFLLNSDLRGAVESPHLYFETDTDLDIDDLMLTQGWRNYKYTEPVGRLPYKLEKGISVSGVVNVKDRKLKNKTVDFLFMTFDDNKNVYTSKIKVPGSFSFQLGDMYGDSETILIQPTGIEEKQISKFTIALNTKAEEPFNFKVENKLIAADSIQNRIVTDNRKNKQFEDKYYTDMQGVNALEEVLVNAYKMTPKRKEMFEKYGEPDVVIDGKEIAAISNKSATGLYSILLAFRDKVQIVRDSLGNFAAESTNSGKYHTNLVIVDGIPVRETEYGSLQFIEQNEVTSFEIIDNPKNFRSLYANVKNTVTPYGDLPGSIIAIYTKNGRGLYGALKKSNTIKLNTISVFSVQKEFYSPKYDTEVEFYIKQPDLRSTVYWNPNIVTTDKGESSISYFHSDDIGDFVIVLESITTDGKIGYKEINYKVR
jgi:hypothetical protein